MLDSLKAQLIRDEGNRLKPYQDQYQNWTIGIGRNLSEKGIRQREADYMLDNDIDELSINITTLMPWADKLDDARRGVLLNMGFNLGIHGLLEFETFLALVQGGNYPAAADDMMKTEWAKEVPARAHRLSVQMQTGVWQ